MPAGRMYKHKRRTLPATPRRGLNRTEVRQTKQIAKQQIRLRSETKQRAWIYPKADNDDGTYFNMEHNKPHFLFGGKNENGLLNLGVGDQSRPRAEGGGLPISKPGQCREGTSVRLQALNHRFVMSSNGPSKNTMLRVIIFKYPSDKNSANIVEGDILLQPTNVGTTIGYPNIFLPLNRYNGRGITFLKDVTYQGFGPTSGAIADESTGETTNWGLGFVKQFSCNYIVKNGVKIKYAESPDGNDATIPAVYNIGMMIVPFTNEGAAQNEVCGTLSILGSMAFKDL